MLSRFLGLWRKIALSLSDKAELIAEIDDLRGRVYALEENYKLVRGSVRRNEQRIYKLEN